MESNRSNLLKHPLVTSFVNEKWRSFGRFIFFTNFTLYLMFLMPLTVYAISLTTSSPSKQACKYIIEAQTAAVEIIVCTLLQNTPVYTTVIKTTNGVHNTLVYKKSVFCTLFFTAHQWCAVKLVCKCHLKVCYAHLISKSAGSEHLRMKLKHSSCSMHFPNTLLSYGELSLRRLDDCVVFFRFEGQVFCDLTPFSCQHPRAWQCVSLESMGNNGKWEHWWW